MRWSFVFSFLFFSLAILCQDKVAQDDVDKIYNMVDNMPRFQGCELDIISLVERVDSATH